MKFLVSLALALLVSSFAQADELVEAIGPAVTWHITDTGQSTQYSNKLTQNGKLLWSPMIGLKKTHVSNQEGYMSLTGFTMNNEVGSRVWGAFGGAGVRLATMMYLGLAYGGYIQNNNDFRAKGIAPMSATGDSNAFVPLVGFEVNSHFDLSQNTFLGWNNLVTPILTMHTLSFGVKL